MITFEELMCCILVVAALALVYSAGRCDLLNVMVDMFVEKAKKMAEEQKNDE